MRSGTLPSLMSMFRDIERCARETLPDLAILCPATARHPDCVEAVAPLGVDILLEKPFAASLAYADRILAAVAKSGVRLAINWPLRWYPRGTIGPPAAAACSTISAMGLRSGPGS
jgi:predicted dehydrogenase